MAAIMVTMVAMAADQVDIQAPILDPNTEVTITAIIKVPPYPQTPINTGSIVGTQREFTMAAL